MLFVDTNSPLTTKPYNFYIKRQYKTERYDQQGFLGPRLGKVRMLHLRCEDLKTRESTLVLTGWTLS